MVELELRPLQTELIKNISVAFREGARNVMVCAPCAFGKTEIATAMLMKTRDNMKRGAFVCDRVSLVNQTSERFDKYGLDHGIRQSSHWRFRPDERIQVCTIQTLASRGIISSDLTIHDEAHELKESARKMLLKREGYSVGLSATPMTRGLGKYFDKIITGATTNQLIALELLVPFEAYDYPRADMTGVKTTNNGEYEEKEGEKRCIKIVGNVVEHYQKHAAGKAFICFAFSVPHADELERQFLSAGIIARCYHYKKTQEENKESLEEFKRPGTYIQGLISIQSLTRGFDATHIEVVICARPLRKAIHEFIQMICRGSRIHPGKEKCWLFDHTGNWTNFYPQMFDYFEHGVTELDDGKPKPKTENQKKEKKPVVCRHCSHVFAGGPFCPACGYPTPTMRAPEHEAGELLKFDGAAVLKYDYAAKKVLYGELKYYAAMRDHSRGWIYHMFKDITGLLPRGLDASEKVPTSNATLERIEEHKQAFIRQRIRSNYGKKRGNSKPMGPKIGRAKEPDLFA